MLNLLLWSITHDWCWCSERRTLPSRRLKSTRGGTWIPQPSIIRLTSLLPPFPYLEICRTKTCVWNFLLINFFLPRLRHCCNILQLLSSSSDLEPTSSSVAAPAKYLSHFAKAKEQLAEKDNWDHLAPVKFHKRQFISYSKSFTKLKIKRSVQLTVSEVPADSTYSYEKLCHL